MLPSWNRDAIFAETMDQNKIRVESCHVSDLWGHGRLPSFNEGAFRYNICPGHVELRPFTTRLEMWTSHPGAIKDNHTIPRASGQGGSGSESMLVHTLLFSAHCSLLSPGIAMSFSRESRITFNFPVGVTASAIFVVTVHSLLHSTRAHSATTSILIVWNCDHLRRL